MEHRVRRGSHIDFQSGESCGRSAAAAASERIVRVLKAPFYSLPLRKRSDSVRAMAKSSKKSFKESVADYAALSERIGRRQFAPVYLLMGEEPYFIDMLAERLGETILSPEERAFDQTVVYGRDTEAGAIVNFCRQMPMMGAFQVVIVREAQTLRRIDQLSLYTSAPSPTTILVLCHKEK